MAPVKGRGAEVRSTEIGDGNCVYALKDLPIRDASQ
jgi:hypothetical protein